jgi:hypothetical protein
MLVEKRDLTLEGNVFGWLVGLILGVVLVVLAIVCAMELLALRPDLTDASRSDQRRVQQQR